MRYRKTNNEQTEPVDGKTPKLRLVNNHDAGVFDGAAPTGPEPLVQPNSAPQDAPDLGEDRTYDFVDGEAFTPDSYDLDEDGKGARREIIAPWLRSKSELFATVQDLVERAFQTAMFHTVRVPLYLSRLAGMSPYGVALIVGWWWVWVTEDGFKENRTAIRSGVSSGDVQKLEERHTQQLLQRWGISVFLTLSGLLALWVSFALLPLWQFIPALGLIAVLLGVLGRPKAPKPVLERVVYQGHHAPKFTESLLLTALRQCGAEPKDARAIQVIQPPAKIRSGWEAVVSLGVPAEKIIEKQNMFSSVLDRPENCVWLSSDTEESAGWLRVVVTRKSLRRTRIPAWPLLDGGSFNYFSDAVPVGVDETGQPVTAKKAYWSSVYGGIMGTGKSVSMMTSLMGLLADPRVEGHVYDLKGGSDWLPLTPILHFLRSGSDVGDHEAIIADLEELNKRMDRRFRTLKNLPDELASPKTNDQLASVKQLDLHPIVVVIDETQEMFELGENRKRYYELVSRVVKKGRAVAITVEAGTQEVNKQSLPISGLCRWRLCHGVTDHRAVEQVLGTGTYSAGYHADKLTDQDVGIGYFGSGKKFSVVKGYFINPDSPDGTTPSELDKAVERYKADRAGKNLLTGMAAGDIEPDDDHETTLDRVKRVWPTGVKKLQWVELVELLHADMPGEYPNVGDLSTGIPAEVTRAVDVLSGQLARHGIEAKSVRAKYRPLAGKTHSGRRGIYHVDVLNANTPDVDMINDNDTGFDDTHHDIQDDIQDDIDHDIDVDVTDDADHDTAQMPVTPERVEPAHNPRNRQPFGYSTGRSGKA